MQRTRLPGQTVDDEGLLKLFLIMPKLRFDRIQSREQRINEAIFIGTGQLSQIGTEWFRWHGEMMRKTSIVYNR